MVRLLVGAVSLTNFEPSAFTANSREKAQQWCGIVDDRTDLTDQSFIRCPTAPVKTSISRIDLEDRNRQVTIHQIGDEYHPGLLNCTNIDQAVSVW